VQRANRLFQVLLPQPLHISFQVSLEATQQRSHQLRKLLTDPRRFQQLQVLIQSLLPLRHSHFQQVAPQIIHTLIKMELIKLPTLQ